MSTVGLKEDWPVDKNELRGVFRENSDVPPISNYGSPWGHVVPRNKTFFFGLYSIKKQLEDKKFVKENPLALEFVKEDFKSKLKIVKIAFSEY